MIKLFKNDLENVTCELANIRKCNSVCVLV